MVPSQRELYSEALLSQWRNPFRTSEDFEVCGNKGTASEDLFKAVTDAKDACMKDLEDSGVPEARCMLQNSYFMSDTCIESMADALGFPAERAIAAARPLQAVHGQCRLLTTEVCIARF